jgi:hypothetical protein
MSEAIAQIIPDTTIQVGDKVKSYDFPDNLLYDPKRAESCFVEGTVMDFEVHEGCLRYKILVTRRVFGGQEETLKDMERYTFPPVNGTPTYSGVTFGVSRI